MSKKNIAAEDRANAIREMQLALFNDYKATFSEGSGKRVLEDLEKICFYNQGMTNNDSSIDPLSLAMREGMRRVVIRIKNYMDYEMFNKEKING